MPIAAAPGPMRSSATQEYAFVARVGNDCLFLVTSVTSEPARRQGVPPDRYSVLSAIEGSTRDARLAGR
jgi:hypothetical protein